MSEDTGVSRKDLKEDRIAICPKYGCEYMKRVKPLKYRFFGFGKHPKCKKHHLHLVYVDVIIGNYTDSALACFFDKSALPSNELIEGIRAKFPQEIKSFVRGWTYCITIGRGAPVVSSYMDGISNGYIKQLSRKQKNALKKTDDENINKISKAIKEGLKEITNQYTRLLKHFRVHSEILNDHKSLKPLSKSLQNYLNEWQKNILKNNSALNSPKSTHEMSVQEIKRNYDEILNVGTCRCLLGLKPESREIKKARITAFDRFSAYYEFLRERLCVKFTRSDILNLLSRSSYFRNQSDYLEEFNYSSTEEYMNNNHPNVLMNNDIENQKGVHKFLANKKKFIRKSITLSELPYPTDLFLRDFRITLSKSGIIPQNFIVKYGTNAGLIENKVFNTFFGLGKSFVTNIIRGVKNSKFYTIAEDDIIHIKKILIKKYFNKAKHCLELINKYREKNKLFLRKHRGERWYYHNPGFKGRFFNNIDTYEKGYWLGFMGADGHVSKRGDFQMVINLSYKDIEHLYTFCAVLGLNSDKVEEFYDYAGYHMCSLRFECRSMVEDLYEHGYTSSKSKIKSIPYPIKKAIQEAKIESNKSLYIWKSNSGKIALAWLYGYYDGDGLMNTTGIACGNKEMLEEIKFLFNIYYDVNGDDGDYYLSVGAHLMNQMQVIYNKGLKRKRKIFDERNDRHFIFKRGLKTAEITFSDIRNLVRYFTIEELAEKLNCSGSFLFNYLSDNNISVPKKKVDMPKEKITYYGSKFSKL